MSDPVLWDYDVVLEVCSGEEPETVNVRVNKCTDPTAAAVTALAGMIVGDSGHSHDPRDCVVVAVYLATRVPLYVNRDAVASALNLT